MTTGQTSAQQQAQAIQVNRQIRNQILAGCPEIVQQIYSTTLATGAPGTVLNVAPRAVGLITRFIVKVTGTVAQSASETLTLTAMGPANIFSQIVYNDLSNTTRIQTSGWHLHFLATMRPANNRVVFGAAYSTDNSTGIGSNTGIMKAPASVTTAQNFNFYYEIPLAYNAATDLRGSVFAAVVNGTQQLQLTINNNFVVGSAADGTLAVYKSSTAATGVVTNLQVVVYQCYYDQLPQYGTAAGYPPLDVSTVYELKNTALSGLVVGQDFPIQYTNQREFLSAFLIYDNAGTLNYGTDINYLSLTAANAYAFFKVDPQTQFLLTRKLLSDDLPPGMYYFDSRRMPINTLQTGNMQLNVNPSVVNAGASVLVGWEAFAYANTITNGASLSAS